MKPDEDPADKLKNLQNIISGFSLKHLSNAARKIQKQTDKPVGISFLSSSSPKPSKEIIFKPDTTLDVSSIDPQTPGKAPEKYFYEATGSCLCSLIITQIRLIWTVKYKT